MVIISLGCIYGVTHLLNWIVGEEEPQPDSFKGSWIFRLALNVLGYATVFIPGILIYKYVKASKYLERAGRSMSAIFVLYIVCMYEYQYVSTYLKSVLLIGVLYLLFLLFT